MQFKVGDNVEWTSQAASVKSTKYGKIVAVVLANEEVQNHFDSDEFLLKFDKRSKYGDPAKRPQISYLVQVERDNDNTSMKLKPYLYWPLVSGLKLVGKSESESHATTQKVQTSSSHAEVIQSASDSKPSCQNKQDAGATEFVQTMSNVVGAVLAVRSGKKSGADRRRELRAHKKSARLVKV